MGRFGLGTARGAEDDQTDERLAAIIAFGVTHGIRVFDTAVNYRSGRSERVLGNAVRRAVAAGTVRRADLVVMTKGGYPRPGRPSTAPVSRHQLDAAYVKDQIELSYETLAVGCIDTYFLHNPEEQSARLGQPDYFALLRDTFAVLEDAVAAGRVDHYGMATWRPTGSGQYPAVEVALLCRLAEDVAGDQHHFAAVQAPLSMVDRSALLPTQRVGDRALGLPAACAELGLRFVASATACQGRLPRLASASSRWAASVPGVETALVGTHTPAHLLETIGRDQAEVVRG